MDFVPDVDVAEICDAPESVVRQAVVDRLWKVAVCITVRKRAHNSVPLLTKTYSQLQNIAYKRSRFL